MKTQNSSFKVSQRVTIELGRTEVEQAVRSYVIARLQEDRRLAPLPDPGEMLDVQMLIDADEMQVLMAVITYAPPARTT